MSAATEVRNTPYRAGGEINAPVKAGTKIFAGTLVVIDAGFAAPGRTAATLRVVGRAEETVDNTTGANGAKTVQVTRGVFLFTNSATDAVTQADTFADCYIEDDQTVAKTAAGKSKAGRVLEVSSDGVWVDTRY